jgi:SAM-dependent methyltransferase
MRTPRRAAHGDGMTTIPVSVDLEAIKSRQQATWSSGDYAVIGTTLQLVGEHLCEAVDLAAGSRVLDVAAGNGNASLAAARRGGDVTATDYVPELLEHAAARAAAEGLRISTQTADAEALPFDDGAFDVVLSTFGVMFTPDADRSSSELQRVCRSGGRIGLANWTPTGFIGRMFKVVGAHVPPPAGIRSPLEWGTEDRLADLFAGCSIDVTVREFVFRYRSTQEWVDTFRTFYGRTLKAFAALGDAGPSLEADLLALGDECNTATDGTFRVPSDYLEIVVRTA